MKTAGLLISILTPIAYVTWTVLAGSSVLIALNFLGLMLLGIALMIGSDE